MITQSTLHLWFLRYLLLCCLSIFLNACGGGSSSGNSNTTTLPNQPENFTAVVTSDQVVLSWDTDSSTTAYEICQAEENISDPSICTIYSGGTLYQNISSGTYTLTNLSDGTTYYFVVTALNSDDNDGTSSSEISIIAAQITPNITGILNDTGITTCGDYAYGNSGNHDIDIDCASADDDGDPIPPGQDALYGRDYNENDDSDGHAGFSFTKLDENGFALDASASSWTCVKDNITGLIWEGKTDDGGLHDKYDSYTWYNTDSSSNGGTVGGTNASNDSCYGYDASDSSTFCNTEAYIARVNAEAFCGASDWRLPTMKEFYSIVDFSTNYPPVDTNYFPYTKDSSTWSATPSPYDSDDVRGLDMDRGDDYSFDKESELKIMLVRGE